LVKKVETGDAQFGKGRIMELEPSDGMFLPFDLRLLRYMIS
jgi:hypothetical protein